MSYSPYRYCPTIVIAVALAWVSLAPFERARAQEIPVVRINEFMAANVTTFPDIVDFDDYSDWIELYNDGDVPVDLEGYSLTDDLTVPLKWPFPSGAMIPPKGFFIVRADGADAAPGQRVERAFAPWDDFTVDHYHTNFKLSEVGEEIGLYRLDGQIENLTLSGLENVWKYRDDGNDLGTVWREVGFDDEVWSSGTGEFGYGEDDQRTTVAFGDDPDNKFTTTYFRRTFQLADVGGLTEMELRILVDDGAVVYLNGEELTRVRMPEGEVLYGTRATVTAPEDRFVTRSLATGLLRAGTNTLAVEVHQIDRDTSDMSFDLELTTRRVPEGFVEVDTVVYGPQTADVSLGREIGSGEWKLFGEPTGGAANTTEALDDPQPTSAVVFSTEGGFFSGAQTVALSTDSPDAVIHYTLDGAWPTSAAPIYTEPFSVAATTVVRARAFRAGMLPGTLVTQTYFIDEPERTLPVVSMAVDPTIFFSDEIGIYENVFKGREAPLNVAWYDSDRVLAFQADAGGKIGGENIWRFAQKPINIAFRGRYGTDSIAYQLFPGERMGAFSRVGFRNGGDNWNDAMLRDALTPDLMRGQMANDVESYRPAVVYMNGQYWGIHNVRQNHDPNYFANFHQVDPTNYDHLEYGHVTSSRVTLGAKEGNVDDYLELEAYADNNDLNEPEHFAYMETRMDMESFMDFIIIEDYVYNSSWRHNREFWRERKDGAKWQWIVPDLDRGFNDSNVDKSLLDNFDDDYDLFEQLMDNDGFKARLAQRYAAHLASTFHPDRISAIVDQRDLEVRDEMPRHIEQWAQSEGIESMSDRDEELEEIKQFARDRAEHVYLDFQGNFDLPETARLTVEVTPAEGGRVVLNGVPMLPVYGNQADLFIGFPAGAVAEPAPGFRFVGWDTGEATAELDVALTADRLVRATFVAEGETVLEGALAESRELTSVASPYAAHGDVIVPAGVTLTLEAGTTLYLQPDADIRVAGRLVINGTEEAPVQILSRVTGQRWGSIALVEAEGVSRISHLVVRGGSRGGEPVLERGAISVVRSEVEIDHLDIDDVFIPVFAWESKITLRDSIVHTPFTGDGINVKHGEGLVERCTFLGNSAPDTDAIDFDDVVNGIIRDNRIVAFRGSNSDGIDVGEGCVDLLVSGNRIYNNSDKGISVGQGSTVRIERNLIVGCAQGVGIKDTGSFATIDQNTFALCDVAVAVFEKNLGAGGGGAAITNTIFSRSKDAPVTVDSLSEATVNYSLSDTRSLVGVGNLLADPDFIDAGSYNFSLLPTSAAIDAGDPAHAADGDGSVADVGAYYVYDPDDFPFLAPNVVVINEILSHSEADQPDWIELHNTSAAPVDISGWFLSDSKADLQKYRIAEGTVLGPNAYLVFYENETFGEGSADPNQVTPFALSENGETVSLFGPGNALALDYSVEETFGPSATGVSRGRYLKSSNTYNFVAMAEPTPGQENGAPKVGPIVISEIMYHPDNGDAEYLELTNISAEPVLLFDAEKNSGWRITDGVEFEFSTAEPVTIGAGEYLVLARNEAVFRAEYPVDASVRVFQWANGGLKNGGERIEFSRPGDVDALGQRQWVRIDRVNYADAGEGIWPTGTDGEGLSLTREVETDYGNDPVNWMAAEPSPGRRQADDGESPFAAWANALGLPAEASGFEDDADQDGFSNGLEYALAGNAAAADGRSGVPEMELVVEGENLTLLQAVLEPRADVVYTVQRSTALTSGSWTDLPGGIEAAGEGSVLRAVVSGASEQAEYYRVLVRHNP